MSATSHKDGMSYKGSLALASLVGVTAGIMGMVLDRRDPLRGFFAGALTGASFAVMVSASKRHGLEKLDYYSEGQPLYEKYETEAGV
jgi:hypothetical protein